MKSPGHEWTFSCGAKLMFRHLDDPSDYWIYHGSQVPWIGFDELTTWPDDKAYAMMLSCVTSTRVPEKFHRVRAACNPGYVGHNWVRDRFQLYGDTTKPIVVRNDGAKTRVAIHGDFRQNLVLMHNQPDYEQNLLEAARSMGPQYIRAWLYGDWDITAGGMFDDLWSPKHHVIPRLDARTVPRSWLLDRAYDDGQSHPFAVLWFAESNGEVSQELAWLMDLPGRPGSVRGDVIVVGEWYGWSGKENEGIRMASGDIARGIVERELQMGVSGRVRPGPADSAIYSQYQPNLSVAGDMLREGVRWEPADKERGSRSQGWRQVRKMLQGAVPKEDGRREEPGLFICNIATHLLRTLPVAPRCKKDPDDVDTKYEDHLLDSLRYRLRARRPMMTVERGAGAY